MMVVFLTPKPVPCPNGQGQDSGFRQISHHVINLLLNVAVASLPLAQRFVLTFNRIFYCKDSDLFGICNYLPAFLRTPHALNGAARTERTERTRAVRALAWDLPVSPLRDERRIAKRFGLSLYFWCQKYQNHPHVAFAGPSLGCAKTGA